MQADTFQPEQYEHLWQQKVSDTYALFNGLDTPQPTDYASPPAHFRMRAEFKIWHDENGWDYVMFERGNKHKHYKITAFPIAHESIELLMPMLRSSIQAREILNQRLFQVEFLASTTGEMLVTLIYHKKLGDEWLEAATSLANTLSIKIIGRAKKQKLCTHEDWLIESLPVKDRTWHYQQVEASFTQPNAAINTQMLSWACEQLGTSNTDLLELYCGNGNFTLPLSTQFRQVLATEISKTSINSALFNCDKNDVSNITFLRMSSEEFTQALNGDREFRRLRDTDLNSYQLNTVLVDPPRAGLDDGTIELIRKFDRILYISCNPITLVENINALKNDFDIESLAFFDQFPYTHHIESGVLLVKR